MITAAEARVHIDERTGFTFNERTGCWYWDTPAPSGYGPYLAFFSAAFGEPTRGLHVYHRCSGGPQGCVRPRHLDLAAPEARIEHVPDPSIDPALRGSVAQRLRDEREARRMSRVDFAREIKVSADTVRAWEAGELPPSAHMLQQLSRRFGWSGQARRFIVTFVHQEVVVERSAGAAMRRVWDSLEPEVGARKTAVYEVRPARPT